MSVGAIKAGDASVSLGLDMTGLKTGLVTASARLKAFGTGVMTAGAGIAAIGIGASLPFWGAIQAASNAAETLNKFQAVFGDQADAADAFASRLGGSIGRGVTEIRDGMSAFQAQMVGLGFGAEQAREMSQELTGLVYDFGSFFNVSDDEALGRFISAMSGSGEVLDRFGVNIKEAAMNSEFLAMGLRVTTANATEQQKAMARFNIIRRTLGAQGAVGDALKTADSFANTMKRVKAQLLDTAIAIGEAVLPAATWLVGIVSTGIGIFSTFAKENKLLFQILATLAAGLVGVGAAMVVFGGGFVLAGSLIGMVVSAFVAVKAAVLGVAGVVGAVFGGMVLPLVLVVGAAVAFTAVMGGIVAGLVAVGGRMLWTRGVIQSVWSKIVEFTAPVVSAIGKIASAVTGFLGYAWQYWRSVFGGMGSSVGGFLSPIIGWFTGKLWPMLQNVFGTISTAFRATWANAVYYLRPLYEQFLQTWGAIKDAVGGGDLSLAWEIVVASMGLAWTRLAGFLTTTWLTWKANGLLVLDQVGDFFIETFASVWTTMKLGFFSVWSWIKVTFLNGLASIADAAASIAPTEAMAQLARAQASGLRLDARVEQTVTAPAALQRIAGEAETARLARAADNDAHMMAFVDAASLEIAQAMHGIDADIAAQQEHLDLLGMYAWFSGVTASPSIPGAPPPGGQEGKKLGKGDSVGTFSSAAIQGMLGSGTPIDRVANIAEQQRILQQQMLAVQQQQLAAFQQGQQWGP